MTPQHPAVFPDERAAPPDELVAMRQRFIEFWSEGHPCAANELEDQLDDLLAAFNSCKALWLTIDSLQHTRDAWKRLAQERAASSVQPEPVAWRCKVTIHLGKGEKDLVRWKYADGFKPEDLARDATPWEPLYAHPSPPVQQEALAKLEGWTAGVKWALEGGSREPQAIEPTVRRLPLTEEQIKALWWQVEGVADRQPTKEWWRQFARAIEAAHGITAEHGTALTQAGATARPLLSEEQVCEAMRLVDLYLRFGSDDARSRVESYLRNLKEGE